VEQYLAEGGGEGPPRPAGRRPLAHRRKVTLSASREALRSPTNGATPQATRRHTHSGRLSNGPRSLPARESDTEGAAPPTCRWMTARGCVTLRAASTLRDEMSVSRRTSRGRSLLSGCKGRSSVPAGCGRLSSRGFTRWMRRGRAHPIHSPARRHTRSTRECGANVEEHRTSVQWQFDHAHHERP
jgi:hypothetical protein